MKRWLFETLTYMRWMADASLSAVLRGSSRFTLMSSIFISQTILLIWRSKSCKYRCLPAYGHDYSPRRVWDSGPKDSHEKFLVITVSLREMLIGPLNVIKAFWKMSRKGGRRVCLSQEHLDTPTRPSHSAC